MNGSIFQILDVTSSVQNKRHCILVFVQEITVEIERQIPSKLNGYSVIIIETTNLFSVKKSIYYANKLMHNIYFSQFISIIILIIVFILMLK